MSGKLDLHHDRLFYTISAKRGGTMNDPS